MKSTTIKPEYLSDKQVNIPGIMYDTNIHQESPEIKTEIKHEDNDETCVNIHDIGYENMNSKDHNQIKTDFGDSTSSNDIFKVMPVPVNTSDSLQYKNMHDENDVVFNIVPIVDNGEFQTNCEIKIEKTV